MSADDIEVTVPEHLVFAINRAHVLSAVAERRQREMAHPAVKYVARTHRPKCGCDDCPRHESDVQS